MAKPLRLVLASIASLLGLIAVIVAAQQITLSYLLPPPTPGGEPTRHTATYGPAVAATVVAVLALLITIGWLVRNIIGAPRHWLWLIPVGALVIGYVVMFATLGMDRPVF